MARRRITRPNGEEVSSYSDLASFPVPRYSRSSSEAPTWEEGFYPVHVTPLTSYSCKVHYVGWPRKFDEVKPYNELCHMYPKESSFLRSLKLQLKEQLVPTVRSDSKISIRLQIDDAEFEMLAGNGDIHKITKSKTVYTIGRRLDFDRILGVGWDYRILNEAGDNLFIKSQTVRFYKKTPKPMKDYILFPDHVEPSFITKPQVMVFTFVKVAGNKGMFKHLLNDDVL